MKKASIEPPFYRNDYDEYGMGLRKAYIEGVTLCLAGQPQKAEKLFHQKIGRYPRSPWEPCGAQAAQYLALGAAIGNAKEPEFLKYYSVAERMIPNPTNSRPRADRTDWRDWHLHMHVRIQATVGEIEHAEQFLNLIKDDEERQDALVHLAEAQAAQGKGADARATLARIENRPQAIILFADAASASLREGGTISRELVSWIADLEDPAARAAAMSGMGVSPTR